MAKSKLTPAEMLEYNKTSKAGKYGSKGVYRDGMFFHSIGEADYYDRLKIQKLSGDFRDFKRQVIFKISINGQQITRYIADFVIERFDGTKQVLDYKSAFTRTLEPYQMKKKLLAALYNIHIIEVGVSAPKPKIKKVKKVFG